MPSDDTNSTRRTVLQGVGGAMVAGTAVGKGAADDRQVVHVSFEGGEGRQAAQTQASEVMREYDFGAMTMEVPEQAIQGLQNNPNIKYVENQGRMEALGETVPYGIEITDSDTAIDSGETGADVSIAVVDTGVDAQHETLQENLGEGYAPTGAACDDSCTDGWTCNPADIDQCLAEWDDDNDHGSHVAGTAAAAANDTGVLGVAPDAEILPVKALDCCGGGEFGDIAAGIEWAANNGADVINLSLGGPESDLVSEAVEFAADQGCVIVAAAGNDGPCSDCVGSPADHPEVIAVSATDENDDLADFSSTGPEVDIAAPGDGVLSTIPRDDYAEFPGTSMASPHVAGAAASVIASGTTDREEVRATLEATADDIGLSSNEQGAGRLNTADAVGSEDDDDDDDEEEPADGSVSVETLGASNVDTSSATVSGELTEIEGESTATVWFEYGPVGTSLSQETGTGDLDVGTFSADLTGLDDGTTYEYRAVAEITDDSDTGAIESFATDEESGGCFITTATAQDGYTLDSLRRFRDESMSANPVGRGMVDLYYAISPPIADTLERHPESATATAVRRIVERCAALSDRQDETDSRLKSTALGATLTSLYMVGITVGATGHAGIRLRERLFGER